MEGPVSTVPREVREGFIRKETFVQAVREETGNHGNKRNTPGRGAVLSLSAGRSLWLNQRQGGERRAVREGPRT